MIGEFKTPSKSVLRAVLAGLFLFAACAKTRVLPLGSPFPPTSRWEKPLDVPLAAPLSTDGTLVFAALSTGSILAIDPATGSTLWTRSGLKPGFVAARPGFLVFVERSGVVWGINAQDGTAQWKTTTSVIDVQSVRLDGNRVFLGGGSGLAALVVTTGEVRFDVVAKDVRDLEAAGDLLASLEEGALMVRNREDGAVKFRLASPEGEFGAPALFADGRVVLGSGTRLVRAISAGGEFRWRFKVGARVKDRPLDYLDGKRVGVISFEGVFYELSLGGGNMQRRALFSSRPFGPPLLTAGRIWAPIFEDEVAALDPRTSKLLGRTRFGGSFLSPPILVAGRLLAEVAGPRRIVALQTAPLS
ncbi:MAG TPA: PQQ-binding-like beta-propeller repeat protein [Vicinamibacteria bacterium]|nr:PQQ-binding-like beta-propeller repeat protein [Vicinamibacteria bacterium]